MTTQDKSLRATLENILKPILKKGIDHRPEIAAIEFLVTLERKAAIAEAVPVVMREILELPCISFVGDAKDDATFAKDCCGRIFAKLFPPLPKEPEQE